MDTRVQKGGGKSVGDDVVGEAISGFREDSVLVLGIVSVCCNCIVAHPR